MYLKIVNKQWKSNTVSQNNTNTNTNTNTITITGEVRWDLMRFDEMKWVKYSQK